MNNNRVSSVSVRCWVALIVLCVASLAAHLALLPQLPDAVPLHFGASGEVDGWGAKWQALLLDVLPLALLALFYLVPRIDPKGHNYERSGKVYQLFVVLFTLMMMAMTWAPELVVFGLVSGDSFGLVVPLMVGVLFVVLGNYLPRVRDNFTFGFRTPWALDDESNWRRTQRFGGVVLIVSGLAFVLAALMGGGVLWFVLAVGLTIAGAIGAYVYSYLLWRASK